MKLLITYLLIASVSFLNYSTQDKSAEILNKMISAVDTVRTATYTLKMKERMIKGYYISETFCKINQKPLNVYIKKIVDGKADVEVLFCENKNNNLALVKPVSFPWVNVNLNPLSDAMRNKQHHSLYSSGFKYFASIIKHLKDDKTGENVFTSEGNYTQNGQLLTKIVFQSKNYKLIDYTVLKNETVRSIANKYFINEYSILLNNKEISTFNTSLKEGQKIKIPNVYAPKMILFLDARTYIPKIIEAYNSDGLYESYEYVNTKINCAFKSDEFTAKFPGYGF